MQLSLSKVQGIKVFQALRGQQLGCCYLSLIIYWDRGLRKVEDPPGSHHIFKHSMHSSNAVQHLRRSPLKEAQAVALAMELLATWLKGMCIISEPSHAGLSLTAGRAEPLLASCCVLFPKTLLCFFPHLKNIQGKHESLPAKFLPFGLHSCS